MKTKEPFTDKLEKIASKMLKNAKCFEEKEEINWCIEQAKSGEKTFIEAIKWCGLDSQYNKAIGTPKYQGLAYFHNYEYRHLLRDWSDFKELAHRKSFRLISNWNDPKAWPNKNDYGSVDNERLQYAEKNWHILYKAIHDSFVKEGLQTDGFSVSHTKIIAKTLHINEKALIDVYHGQVKGLGILRFPLTIYFYSDPGHGWGGVPRVILTLLEIESYISACSYQVGDMVWLEEDCDLSVLCMALINQNIEFKFTDIPVFFGNQDIRTCKHYKPE